MAAPFKIVGIDHVVLRAADPAALERFYPDVLGLTFELRQDSFAPAGRGSTSCQPTSRGHATPGAARVCGGSHKSSPAIRTR